MSHALLPFAKRMRRNSTEAEARLWWHLRAVRFQGFKIRRQQPLGDYIVDFICFERRLIIEVDGSQHLESVARDDARTAWLRAQGFVILRFWSDDVLRDSAYVLQEIAQLLGCD